MDDNVRHFPVNNDNVEYVVEYVLDNDLEYKSVNHDDVQHNADNRSKYNNDVDDFTIDYV